MNTDSTDLSFWGTVRLLLSIARKRSQGRSKRQQELLQTRTRGKGTDWGFLGTAMSILLMFAINVVAAVVVDLAVESGERIESVKRGKIVVSLPFLDAVRRTETEAGGPGRDSDNVLQVANYRFEAKKIAEEYGGSQESIEKQLRDAMREHGSRDFVAEGEAIHGFAAFPANPFAAMLGSLILLWWGMMLVFQGEGLELDLQRRRHPMWEWLFSHPVPPGAVFLAEMLSPLAVNPVYWAAPLFVGVVYGLVYGPLLGVLATFLIGPPLAIAAGCVGKALEISTILRFPPRSRGAVIGFMGWLGYASMMLLFLGAFVIQKVFTATWKFLAPLTFLPWPWLKLFLGGQADGSFSFLTGMLTCWLAAGVALAGAVWFSVWGTRQGLSGNTGWADTKPTVSKRGGTAGFGRDPLYRKEFLWFIRDRSAIVQTILIPLTVAGVQLFNFRGVLSYAQGAWNYLCGTAILFGTYFLWILGPKSLASEGSALWIALTWPRGLENLLKAKAWLWSLIAAGMVALVLGYTAFLFPANSWQILLVGIGWWFFGRSMAEKTVTLVTVTSSSGEPEKVSKGRMWAAQLGMLTFALGILTQQWHIAVMGIVYSYITAAAMWENFRARLPYLYDPWSERLPPPPTLMHAMVAISILVESAAVLTSIVLVIVGREGIAVAQAISYGICAVIVSIGVDSFLRNRDVSLRDVWCWTTTKVSGWTLERLPGEGAGRSKLILSLLAGAAGGVVLGLFAHGYLAVLRQIPATAEILRKSQEQLASIPGLRISYAVMAIAFAPFAEEYLFRGLLYRALDREWGGWQAVIGSAAFFAVYHHPLSWLPVFLLGVSNALLFKKSGYLAPAVVLHLVYNAVVTL